MSVDEFDNSKIDIRWMQRFENYENSLRHIEKTLEIQERDIIQKAGLVQFFEITFELAWKLLKDYLEGLGHDDVKSPRPVIKKAFELELIENGHLWLQILVDRNLTTHVYDEAMAKKIDVLIEEKYYPLFKKLYEKFLSIRK